MGDARALPFPDSAFDAIATEPPYHPEAEQAVLHAMSEMARVLKPGGRLSVLCSAWQAPALRARAAERGLVEELESPLDRKGLAVYLFVWRTPGA